MAKVLVVDDSLSVRKVVERALAARRIEAVTVASGVEALERIEREAPDVVVCDVVMPDRDGWEICEFVKGHARLGDTPVLLMSGVVDDAVRARAREAGAAAILAKPFGADDLLRRLDELLPAALPGPAHPDAAPADAVAGAATAANGHEPARREDLTALLARLGAVDGVQWVVLADRDGFLLDAVSAGTMDAEAVAALGATVAGSSTAVGRETGRGGLVGTILEYEAGLVLVHDVAATVTLVIGISGPSALGRVRYAVKKALPELGRAV